MRIALLTLFCLVSCFLFGQLRFEYDENQAPASSLPRDFTAFDGRLFFVAEDGFHGRQIWCHDPMNEQTFLISDFSENHDVTDMGKLTVFKDALFFSGSNDERRLWRLRSGENTPEPVSIPDSLQTLNLLTATADHLYWISHIEGRRYFVQMDDESNLLQVKSLSTNYPLNLAALEGDVYVFLNGGHGIRRFSPSSGILDTVARNTLGHGDLSAYLSIAVANGKLFAFTRARSRWRLAIYDPAVDSLFINETATLEGHNFMTPLVSLNDRIFVHQTIQDTGMVVREYFPESNTFRRPEGIDRWQDRYNLFQEFGGKLLLSDRLSPFISLSRPLLYDTETNEATEGPDLGSSLDHNSPQRYGERQMTLLNDDWYYAGAENESDIEPYRYQPDSDQYGQLVDIHQGTASAIIQRIQPFVNNQLLVSYVQRAYRYDPLTQEAIDLAEDIPGLGWDYYSSVYPLTGYLVFGDVIYQDTFYRAIAYDSSQQLMVPILTNDVICNGGLNKWTGPFVEWNGDIWFSACAEDSTTNKTSLFRYTPGSSAPERIPLNGRITVGAIPGHETIMLLKDRLFIITNTSFFQNEFEMITYHPQEGVQQIDSPVRPSFLVQMNGADSVAYYLARLPTNEDITLAYQPDGRISALSVGNDSLRLLGTDAVATIPDDRRHYLLARGGDKVGIYRFDPLMDTTGIVKILSPDITSGFNLVHHLSKLYFAGDTRDFGTELHALDLATNEVQRIADIRPGSLDGGAYHSLSYQERLFFEATGNFRGRELWSYRPSCFSLEASAIPSNINRPTGEVSLNITDGTAPYQYLWSNGATTASLENVAAGFYEVTVTDSRGCSGSGNTWVETDGIISSSTEQRGAGSIKVYPNPFYHQLQLDFAVGSNTATDYAVYSINGRRLQTGQVPHGEQIDLDLGSLPSGILVLVLTNETGGAVLVQKIIKQ